MVPTEHAELGTTLRARVPGRDAALTVVEKPFFDPKKGVPKS